MNKNSECAVCAWRADCKLKYTYQSSGLNCKEFTKDLTLFPQEKDNKPETAETKDKKR